jgi:hypothetical protein
MQKRSDILTVILREITFQNKEVASQSKIIGAAMSN